MKILLVDFVPRDLVLLSLMDFSAHERDLVQYREKTVGIEFIKRKALELARVHAVDSIIVIASRDVYKDFYDYLDLNSEKEDSWYGQLNTMLEKSL
jgi:hypothetical protein